MQRVAVVDYGGSNLRSVVKAIEHVAGPEFEVQVAARPEQLLAAERVVFPGQGAIGDCMTHLLERDLVGALRECVRTRPFFGICLGLQSLMASSDEDGGTACLDVFPGGVHRFPADAGPAPDGSPRKIPHMGWNEVRWTRPHAFLLRAQLLRRAGGPLDRPRRNRLHHILLLRARERPRLRDAVPSREERRGGPEAAGQFPALGRRLRSTIARPRRRAQLGKRAASARKVNSGGASVPLAAIEAFTSGSARKASKSACEVQSNRM